ncbi:MAG: outer membrane beta-barrel domain-containing protein [Gammaproteobacteria bacterium]|nr:outer membrane beta-barrel domain-containing protein [Gammaproteobacteria bacterium]
MLWSGSGLASETIGESLRSEPIIQPEIARREIEDIDIDEEDFEVGLFVGFLSIEDFGTDVVYGARLAYHVTEGIFMEMALGRSEAGETSYETLSGDIQLLPDEDRKYTYYNLSLGYNLLPGEVFISDQFTFNSQFYLIGGIGSTHFAGNDEFTVNIGAGYRLLLTDWVALHLDLRDHMFDSDLLGEEKTTHNLEYHAGLTLFF